MPSEELQEGKIGLHIVIKDNNTSTQHPFVKRPLHYG